MDDEFDLVASLEDPQTCEAVSIYDDDGNLIRIHGDLSAFVNPTDESLRTWPRSDRAIIPDHDLLCAGFPCQPFSKSGSQRGFEDLRGTVFHYIALILEAKRPRLILLENVGNFDRHDSGNTWRKVHETLTERLGYEVSATRHKTSGGPDARGLLSPHHLGHPHHRERFFIIAQQPGAEWPAPIVDRYPFPERPRTSRQVARQKARARSRLTAIIDRGWKESKPEDLEVARVGEGHQQAIKHWQGFLDFLAEHDDLSNELFFRASMPSFPIWGYELDPWQWYPTKRNPGELLSDYPGLTEARSNILETAATQVAATSGDTVDLLRYPPRGERKFLSTRTLTDQAVTKWIETWPAYAGQRSKWPRWKQRFIAQNREWAILLWTRIDPRQLRAWLDELWTRVPAASSQKLEWNCKGEALSLEDRILQFRPSGLRVKRFTHVPALVAMTTTQVPVVFRNGGSAAPHAQARHLLTSEALQLQGFPESWHHPDSKEAAFRAFGNAVHCGLVKEILSEWLLGKVDGQTTLGLQH